MLEKMTDIEIALTLDKQQELLRQIITNIQALRAEAERRKEEADKKDGNTTK